MREAAPAGVLGMSRSPPAPLDVLAARRARVRAVQRYSGQSVLADEVAARMDTRLELVKAAPLRTLDAACGTGSAQHLLRARYPRSGMIALDDVEAELRLLRHNRGGSGLVARLLSGFGIRRGPILIAGTLDRVPLAPESVDLVWSNLALHRYTDPLPVLQDLHRVLTGEGLLMFSTLGPDTLKELRTAFAKADPGQPHVHDFIDMHDLGDMLIASGFSAPVMDMETITLTYASVTKMAADLRAMGAANALQSRRRGLSGRALWKRLADACAPLFKAGRLPASFEIVYGHAWKPLPRPPAAAGPQVLKFHPSISVPPSRQQ